MRKNQSPTSSPHDGGAHCYTGNAGKLVASALERLDCGLSAHFIEFVGCRAAYTHSTNHFPPSKDRQPTAPVNVRRSSSGHHGCERSMWQMGYWITAWNATFS